MLLTEPRPEGAGVSALRAVQVESSALGNGILRQSSPLHSEARLSRA
jgi:hypothetical protein